MKTVKYDVVDTEGQTKGCKNNLFPLSWSDAVKLCQTIHPTCKAAVIPHKERID